jgi:cell division protein ZapA
MSESDVSRLSVRILDKEYFVACPPDERADLLDSAEYLSKKMREIRDTGKVVGTDRIAVMVALNLTNELLKARKQESALSGPLQSRVKGMRDRVESSLQKNRQLEF